MEKRKEKKMDKCRKCGKMFEGIGKFCPDCKAELSDENKHNPLQEAPVPISKSQESIAEIVDATKDLLLYKNRLYGDSALNPIGIFTEHIKTVPANTASILVRLDDKLGRVKNAPALRINDVSDIIGYCTLLLVSMGATKEDIEKFKD
jgi:hypothetical protein